MSATGRNIEGHERESRNFYRTPGWATNAIWQEVVLKDPDYRKDWLVLDAGCGDGAILGQLMREGHPSESLLGIELDEELAFRTSLELIPVLRADFLKFDDHRAELIIMNPPFPMCLAFAERALLLSKRVLMLMRVGFVETPERQALLRRRTPDIHFLPTRPKFAHGSTDNTQYAWFAWGFHWESPGGQWSILEAKEKPVGRARRGSRQSFQQAREQRQEAQTSEKRRVGGGTDE